MTNIIFDGIDLSNIDEPDQPEKHSTGPILGNWDKCTIEYNSFLEAYIFENVPYNDKHYTLQCWKGIKSDNLRDIINSPHATPSLMDYVKMLTAARYHNHTEFIQMIEADMRQGPMITRTRSMRLDTHEVIIEHDWDHSYSLPFVDTIREHYTALYGEAPGIALESLKQLTMGEVVNWHIPEPGWTNVLVNLESNLIIKEADLSIPKYNTHNIMRIRQ